MKKATMILISALALSNANAMDMSDPNPTIDIKLLRSMDNEQTECVVSHGCKIPTDADVADWAKTASNPRPEDIRTRQCLKGAMRDCGVGVPASEREKQNDAMISAPDPIFDDMPGGAIHDPDFGGDIF